MKEKSEKQKYYELAPANSRGFTHGRFTSLDEAYGYFDGRLKDAEDYEAVEVTVEITKKVVGRLRNKLPR